MGSDRKNEFVSDSIFTWDRLYPDSIGLLFMYESVSPVIISLRHGTVIHGVVSRLRSRLEDASGLT